MEKIADIEIRVVGNKGNLALSPDNYDISEIASILQNVESLLYPSNKRERPIITYDLQEGSVRHIFKTGVQAVIGFGAVLSQIQNSGSIDFLDLKTAKAIENIQNLSYQKNYEFEIKTSSTSLDYQELAISPTTKFLRTENLWAEAELYFYGTLTNAGGKTKANIHLDTEEFGSITIDTKKEFLEDQDENLLYKKYGIRALGKQNIETGEIDRSSLQLVELIDYDPLFDESYLNALISKAKNNWAGIDPNDWLQNLRGSHEA